MNPMIIEEQAPVIGEAETQIQAPVDVVWSVLTDFNNWPKWNTGVTQIYMYGDAEVGAEFIWVGGGSKIRSRIELMDTPHRIVWSGKALGTRAVHEWQFEALGTHTRAITRESLDGWLVKLLKGPMRKMLKHSLEQGMDLLKKEAESRAREGA